MARILGSKKPLIVSAEGRRKVALSPQLMEAAQDLAKFMASTDKYGHIAGGSRPAARAKQHGYNYCIISENIATCTASQGAGASRWPANFSKAGRSQQDTGRICSTLRSRRPV
jgi:hypothetical protein